MTSRYHRQQQVPQFGAESQPRLADARVLIVGLGGLGGPVASWLVGAGVGAGAGHITLVDHDVVTMSNLHRQTLFSESDIGQTKVQAAKKRLQACNSDTNIETLEQALSPDNAGALVRAHTVVVDAADSFSVSYLLSDLCLQYRVPLVAASVLQTGGYLGVFCGTAEKPAPSMRAIFPAPPLGAQSCSEAGVTGPSVGVISSYQAQEVLKVIQGDSAQLLGKLMYLDLWQYQHHIVSFENALEPKAHALMIAEKDVAKRDVLLDVREANEINQAPRPRTIAHSHVDIPVDQLAQRHRELDRSRRIVCVCKSGQRALNAAQQLLEKGFNDVAVVVS